MVAVTFSSLRMSSFGVDVMQPRFMWVSPGFHESTIFCMYSTCLLQNWMSASMASMVFFITRTMYNSQIHHVKPSRHSFEIFKNKVQGQARTE
jgi:hypothetical protein